MKINYDCLNIEPKTDLEREKLERLLSPYELLFSKPEIDYQSGAEIERVSRNEMPFSLSGRVYGLYNPRTHKITLDYSLPQQELDNTLAHEREHALGTHDERLTDAKTSTKLGRNTSREFSPPGLAAYN